MTNKVWVNQWSLVKVSMSCNFCIPPQYYVKEQKSIMNLMTIQNLSGRLGTLRLIHIWELGNLEEMIWNPLLIF